jgi:uncharacterized protein (DUF1810 family)
MGGQPPRPASDPFDLERFVTAQAGCYQDVVAELRAGAKRTHWMWFVFPQLRGLGSSATARYFALSGTEEARAYWEHPLLGGRLRECVALLLAVDGRTAQEIFGSPDDLKLRSSLTLFAQVTPQDRSLAEALDRFFGGIPDERTLAALRP